MKARLRHQLFEVVKEHKVLNTMETCRLLNGREKEDFDWCCKGLAFGHNRTAPNFNAGRCNHAKNGCNPKYRTVHTQLGVLERRHYLRSRRMRFFDNSSQALATDIFRFWFIDRYEFMNRILRQTLIPYMEDLNKIT